MDMPVLSVRNLKQYFRSGRGKNKLVVKAIDDVSFDIFKGEVFGLVGESGCGKTTTGRTIIKLYEPTDGEVFFLGQRISAGVQGNKDAIKPNKQKVDIIP
jgi:ABC-type oligopeptide transport system ATPase subunit